MRKIWLFQAVPTYKISKEIRERKGDTWELNQYRDEVKTGDIVVLWQSGDEAGIYGLGKVGKKLDVYIEYGKPALKKAVLKKDLLKHPLLSKLLVTRNPHGRNPYLIKAAEWRALKKLLGR